MFKLIHQINVTGPEVVDMYAKAAANHQLQCLYKIGIYGKIQQHEIFIIGTPWNYWGFISEIHGKVKRKV